MEIVVENRIFKFSKSDFLFNVRDKFFLVFSDEGCGFEFFKVILKFNYELLLFERSVYL